MYFTRLSIAVLLAPFIASCQSYTSKVDKALPTESPPVIQTPVIQTPAIEVSAVMMNSIIYNEIISQLPEDDKFGGFSDKYTKLINRYNSIYYSDVLISEWDQIDKKYKLPAVILNSIKPIKSTYIGVNGYGKKFNVYKVILKDDRIAFINHDMESISIDMAKELDGTKVRVYYRLNNKGLLNFNSGDSASYKTEICRNRREENPSSNSPFDIWDFGCEISADIIKVVALKNNKELKLNNEKPMPNNDNYNVTDRAFDILRKK